MAAVDRATFRKGMRRTRSRPSFAARAQADGWSAISVDTCLEGRVGMPSDLLLTGCHEWSLARPPTGTSPPADHQRIVQGHGPQDAPELTHGEQRRLHSHPLRPVDQLGC